MCHWPILNGLYGIRFLLNFYGSKAEMHPIISTTIRRTFSNLRKSNLILIISKEWGSVPDLPLPGPWVRLNFWAPSVKIEACDAREPYGNDGIGLLKGPGGVQGAKPSEAKELHVILSACIMNMISPIVYQIY